MAVCAIYTAAGLKCPLEYSLWAAGDRLKPTRHDARYQGMVSVSYPLHRFFREHDFSVMRKFGCRNVEYVDLRCPDVRQAVPSWMVDADLCGRMTCGLQPVADLSTPLKLVRWLEGHPTAGL